ncbi:hypothetical protein CH260_12690 [Rhodococcus sp. 05-2256-B2]|uniref:hypothetical protein n=1 Tax=unclassified Rhodococcus (in: high G+C Gram-positive bacteria) TaxID=192944 RepID=UPI000B9BD3E2|nr:MULTISPECIES: hypothetical protein [unclassified Rhodococcus (in: high G+C Gram-positive bacteria)]OZD82909.1 hypothetical protein CH258_18195 [Rhodococcus sp. 05-2256-B4]OZD96168.1 hypothetical protein CH260_12690 [Rhodococcus sp. 05-2256-B2]OZD96590.1 hypothetical protein CH257_04850 [Rhodococcus sp. 05-2256-B3]OZD99566.1 hypothetical protein CH285_20800 [Rhodococcus sp. 05-2256-B1]
MTAATASQEFGTVSVEVERHEDFTLFTGPTTHVTDPAQPEHPYEVHFSGTRDDGDDHSEALVFITRDGQPVSSFPSHIAAQIGLAIIQHGRDAELFGDPQMIGDDQRDAFRR